MNLKMILVPALITLAVTLLRLVGELQHWSTRLFNPAAGGGGALIGIVWLVPIFGVYFALKLAGRGEGPTKPWRPVGLALLAFAFNSAALALAVFLKLSIAATLSLFAVTSWLAIFIAYKGWPALGKTLLAYGLAARIPVVLVMLVAIFGSWGTHYDLPPPDAPEVGAMAPLVKWFWIGLLPQLTIWIYVTVVGGILFGSIAAAIAARRSATA